MSYQARTAAADAAAAAHQAVYASHGHTPNCVSGKVRPQGYADPQVNPGVYQTAMSHPGQGVHETDATGVATEDSGEFGHGSQTGR